jgi:hypothetical protein
MPSPADERTVAVPLDAYDKLVKRTMRLMYPAPPDYTPELAARHYHCLETACITKPEFLLDDLHLLLERLEAKHAAEAV